MMIVDSHVHVCPLWYEPVETLLFQMERNSVNKALLVPMVGKYNEYEYECIGKYPGRFASISQVDGKRPDALDLIEADAEKGAVGIRIGVEDLPEADHLPIWRKAAQLGLNVSCHGSIDNFSTKEFIEIVEEFSDLKIVLEHLGGAAKTKKFPKPNYQLFHNVLTLSRYSNVYLKLPGFGEFFDRPRPLTNPVFDHAPEQIKILYDAFGPKRIMWGSDFPNCSSREGYHNVLLYPLEKIAFLNQEDKEWIFGKTALSVWNIPD
jgi:L-fuconolactonase